MSRLGQWRLGVDSVTNLAHATLIMLPCCYLKLGEIDAWGSLQLGGGAYGITTGLWGRLEGGSSLSSLK